MAKQRGGLKPGPVPQDRVEVMIRIDRATAEWLDLVAERSGQSRNKAVEAWVEVLRSLERIYDKSGRGMGPDILVRGSSSHLLDEAVKAKLVPQEIIDAWDFCEDEWKRYGSEKEAES